MHAIATGIAPASRGTTQAIAATTGVTSDPGDIFINELYLKVATAFTDQLNLKCVHFICMCRVVANIVPGNGNNMVGRIEIVPDKVAALRVTAGSAGRPAAGINIGPKRGNNGCCKPSADSLWCKLRKRARKGNIAIVVDIDLVVGRPE